jgi:hypothetical protein
MIFTDDTFCQHPTSHCSDINDNKTPSCSPSAKSAQCERRATNSLTWREDYHHTVHCFPRTTQPITTLLHSLTPALVKVYFTPTLTTGSLESVGKKTNIFINCGVTGRKSTTEQSLYQHSTCHSLFSSFSHPHFSIHVPFRFRNNFSCLKVIGVIVILHCKVPYTLAASDRCSFCFLFLHLFENFIGHYSLVSS